uniref:Uncharacterized protein n=1 Tax=Arundo donax TaxID=35708 RepID=A0A0A9G131_ARUDO
MAGSGVDSCSDSVIVRRSSGRRPSISLGCLEG